MACPHRAASRWQHGAGFGPGRRGLAGKLLQGLGDSTTWRLRLLGASLAPGTPAGNRCGAWVASMRRVRRVVWRVSAAKGWRRAVGVDGQSSDLYVAKRNSAVQRERTFEMIAQFFRSALLKPRIGQNNLRSLSEFLYLYGNSTKSLKSRLQAIFRRSSWPEYRAGASL